MKSPLKIRICPHVACVAIVAVFLSLAGCSTLQYDVQVDRDPSMRPCTTWAWHPRGNRVVIADPTRAGDAHQRISNAIEQQLAAKGVHRVALDKPQLLAAFDLGAMKRTQVTEWAETTFQGRETSIPLESRDYRQGTLVVFLIDSVTNRLLWRARVDATVEDPTEAMSRINEMVAKMFDQYP